MASRIPITIITGFAGSGKTTLILNLLPQLRAENPGYKLALIKNEIGDLNVDSQLAAAAEMTGSQELLGDCICCTNVGQIGDALATLDKECNPDRIIIETSGSAEPLKLVLEVNRLAKESGRYELDGIVSVVDAENWYVANARETCHSSTRTNSEIFFRGGYANTSFTAKLQAQQTDLIVINKWEGMDERAFDIFLDRLGDLDVDTPQTKSDKGWISKDLLFGFDSKMARAWMSDSHSHDHGHEHKHDHDHRSEMECLSVTLTSPSAEVGVDLEKLEKLLKSAPKDEVYRIKAVLYSNNSPRSTDGSDVNGVNGGRARYILNWSFGRWMWSHDEIVEPDAPTLRMSIFTAQYESTKWTKKIESGQFIALAGEATDGVLAVKRVQ
jgi:G3E family GTPase